MLLAMLLATCVGCVEKDIDTRYGRRKGIGYEKSVNGTAVLAEMIEQEGYEVVSWHALSPALEKADVIIWFPDNFNGPPEETRDWLEDWLRHGGRTLVYVGRDYDAAPDYWKKILPTAPADQVSELQSRKKDAEDQFTDDRLAIEQKPRDYDWFRIDGKLKNRKVRTLTGPWSEGIDASKVEIELNGRLRPSGGETLLSSTDGKGRRDVLVRRRQTVWWGDSQLVIIQNGSFLLNLPLVNHEHRQLAGKLIEQIEDVNSVGRVVFLESGSEGPRITDQDPAARLPTGSHLIDSEPFVYAVPNVLAVVILLLLSRWPIFGRPREPAGRSPSDFGRHVHSLGDLLARSRDVGYAKARLSQYQEQVRGEGT